VREPGAATRCGGEIIRAALLLGLLAGAAGCSEQARYKTLTFFFTGVPEPGAAAGTDSQRPTRDSTQAAVARLAKEAAARRQQALEKIFTHGPVGAKACDSCHSLGGTASFSGAKASRSALPSFGARLLAPKEVICGACHTAKLEGARIAGRWLHGPTANGACLECHNPHRSPRRYLLQEKLTDLCVRCHEAKAAPVLAANGAWAHGPSANGQCTLCHDPHAADQPHLVKAASVASLCTSCHEPADIRRNPVHPEDELPDCVECHNPHGSTEDFLLQG